MNTLQAPSSVAGWLAAVGSGLAAIAFVLPWSANGVIGGQGNLGYLGQWGLANPAYLLVVTAAVAVLVLQLRGGRPSPWISSGVIPLALGGILVGLDWAYVAGPFGGGTGVAASACGAALMIVAGVIAFHEERHAGGAPGV